ncbi:MAG: hypothetical protein JNK12_01355 [Acidimicrobiales bacterium]|nr:hypothetical protein [Acidimicrobiales bacterium]
MITSDVDAGPVPEDNLPGHHPDHEQDKPDLTAVAERLGTVPPGARASEGREHEAGDEDRSLLEVVEAGVVAGVGLGAGLARAGVAAGTVVAGAAVRQAGRRIGLSR